MIFIFYLFFFVFWMSITLVPWNIGWNVSNYRWGFFYNELGIFSYYIISNNILDTKTSSNFYFYIKSAWIILFPIIFCILSFNKFLLSLVFCKFFLTNLKIRCNTKPNWITWTWHNANTFIFSHYNICKLIQRGFLLGNKLNNSRIRITQYQTYCHGGAWHQAIVSKYYSCWIWKIWNP